MPITEMLVRNAQNFPDKTCLMEINPDLQSRGSRHWKEYQLVEGGNVVGYRKELTWKEFDERANQFANLLLENDIKKGDKVAILLMNCIEWLPIYFGALKAGAIVVPLNFRYTSDEIKYCLDLADISVLAFGPEFIERIEAIQHDMPDVKLKFFVGNEGPDCALHYEEMAANCPKTAPGIPLSDDDFGAIYFSSGTTGFPKAILHKHKSLMHAAATEQKHHGQQEDDIFLCIPPLYHTGAKMHWFGSLKTGGKGVLLRDTSPHWILDTASEENASIVWLLVPWAQDILDALDCGEISLDDYNLDNWRLMHIGAQPVPPSLIERWKEYFPHHDYDTNYGLSESIGPGCVHLGIGNTHKVGAIGKAGYGWQTKIVDEERNEVQPGEVGELAVRGDGLMEEYYKNPEESAKVLHNGWLLTGDMAKEDEDGFIFLVDRKKDVVIMGGENIYPVQIEDFLHSHDKIKDVAVIGLPHRRLGEIPAAIVELKPNRSATQEELLEFCAALPRYKRPRIIFFDDVPRNGTGKIEKPALRDKYVGDSLIKVQTESLESGEELLESMDHLVGAPEKCERVAKKQ